MRTIQTGVAAMLVESRRQLLARGATMLSAGLFSAACQAPGSADPGAADGTASGETGPVKWLFYASPARLEAYQKIQKAFNETHTGRGVEIEVVPPAPGAYYTAALVAQLSAGQPADVANSQPVELPGHLQRGFFQPLDSYLAKDRSFKLDDYVPASVEMGRYRNKQYGLPHWTAVNFMTYNVSLFQKAGVALPNTQWTWEEMRQAATRLTERAAGETNVFGLSFPIDFNKVVTWIRSAGGAPFDRDKDPTKSTMSNPKTMQALQFLVDLRQKDRVAPNLADAAGRTLNFPSGKFAMEMKSGSLTSFIRDSSFEWDVQLIPRGPGGRVDTMTGFMWSIMAGTKLPQSAWTFLKFVSGPPGMRESMLIGDGVPPHKALFDEYRRLPAPPKNRSAIIAAQDFARPVPQAIPVEQQYGTYTTAFEAMFEGKKSVQETCLELDRLMDPELARWAPK